MKRVTRSFVAVVLLGAVVVVSGSEPVGAKIPETTTCTIFEDWDRVISGWFDKHYGPAPLSRTVSFGG